MSYPQQPPYSYRPNPSMDPFASRRNLRQLGRLCILARQQEQRRLGGMPYASYAQGPRPAPSILSHGDGRYVDHSRSGSRVGSVMSQYNLGVDPAGWTTKPEADDFLHDPHSEKKGRVAVAYSLARHFMNKNKSSTDAWCLIDVAKPKGAYTIPSYHDPGRSMKLVFSDEFETDGRSFYPGDDPYWQAVDLHYWQTGDHEWYDPSAVTTKNGSLEITLSKVDDISLNYNLSHHSGMISFWNQFCFMGGILVSSVTLPGTTNVLGLWPAVWAMGNLGRAGYGGSLDSHALLVFLPCHTPRVPAQSSSIPSFPPSSTRTPLTPDRCGRTPTTPAMSARPNYTLPDNSVPQAAFDTGGANKDAELSFLPGQRLSACTCAIDVFEATIGGSGAALVGQVSQSAQWAPFDAVYRAFNSTDKLIIPDTSISAQNVFVGNYILWITDDKLAWTMNGNMVGADSVTEIGACQVPVEPMYVIMNLSLSESFGAIDFAHLTFPAVMRVDWVRVYQDPDNVQVGCNPAAYPTADYFMYMEAYTNANLTTWVDDFHQVIPKNRLADTC
ncbi:glycoside hydrolase family 16 protein [Mycena galericulata]|nr:glycoside hydrolase family 16 protein [Mycena galericulata]